MKRIETLLPKVLPSQNNFELLENLRIGQSEFKPFAKFGLVPTDSQAFKAVIERL